MLSRHAVVGRAGVVGAVKIAVAVVDEGQRQGLGQKAALRAATAATQGVTTGRTKTRHDREITIGKEGTIERWAKQEGPVASRDSNLHYAMVYYRTTGT
jgi:hypothetical protein